MNARNVAEETLAAFTQTAKEPPPLAEEREAQRQALLRDANTNADLAALAEKMRIARLFGAKSELIDLAREACARAPEALEIHMQLASILEDAKDYPGALEALAVAETLFRTAVGNADAGSLAHVHRARIFAAQGDDDAARRALHAAVAAQPEDLRARAARAEFPGIPLEIAWEDARAILAYNPEDRFALRLLARLLPAEAMALLTRAIVADPSDIDARVARALLPEMAFEAALEDLRIALENEPLGATIYSARARLHAAAGNALEAALDGAAVWVFARIGAPVRSQEHEEARDHIARFSPTPGEERDLDFSTIQKAVSSFAKAVGPAEAAALFAVLPLTADERKQIQNSNTRS